MKQSFEIVICIMSGTTVQRGECAIADKYTRAEAAVREGADIVLELPYPYSSLGARDFAASGVHIATALGIPTLAFGTEDSGLDELVRLLSEKSFQEDIKKLTNIKGNLSYPKARQELIEKLLGKEKAELLTKPNNILGIEYMISAGNRLSFFPIKRNLSLKSASIIRAMGKSQLLSELPEHSAELFTQLEFRSLKNIELAIIAKLRMMPINELTKIYDITKDFAVRIKSTAQNAVTIEQLYELATAPTDTKAKVRRAILHSFLGAESNSAKKLPAYTMLLAAKRNKLNILNELNVSEMPVLAKPAHYKNLSLAARQQFELSQKADDILALAEATPKQGGESCKKSPIII